ncbi:MULTISPECIES: methylmalonyl Co-A mutase-associated GTPase MeaB [Robiginitalea]|uniref:Arginine/ornithine transport system ATPase n=1 Tax=Robiginitalea biformata (strain ATCC BAA-864 / DSM 15991 / KCTC 12146 / HTCC2501) TaxID=313596 RepID=A4CMS0_ROBBH|nr:MULTISPECIES: methylmalonyl Co-A mutase-associated GTPase MeaB [Robiginitalea]EAR14962.1 arginine/ornithine transport system ATPase [Robiginitalea biformata HTCC2501]MDC6355220.1 methylmalonyl Co-A mutase-associated GTPase MeaB [Robiginitalea sp. PM2]MDC6375565.1 methylmalonyl Co-A mutase-associated GTPase MeaB [Robiginitalea sp. SP8]
MAPTQKPDGDKRGRPDSARTESARGRSSRPKPGPKDLLEGIRTSDRTALARGITLVESTLPDDREAASELVESCLPFSGNSIRIGVTGVPGAGKSTFIESLGGYLTGRGLKVAVLAVDPTSSLSKGSILGDKTRMNTLSRDERAFIRPSPAGTSLGGVTRKTRETISLCEAAGYEVILIETVGVGQSETAVHGMVDFFLLLKIAGAGDELQGIKRGIVEMADAIVINKADGANREAARRARSTFEQALHLYPPKPDGWRPEVLLCSSTEHTGIEAIWDLIDKFREKGRKTGAFQKKREQQYTAWFRQAVSEQLLSGFYEIPGVGPAYDELEQQVVARRTSPFRAAQQLLDQFGPKR